MDLTYEIWRHTMGVVMLFYAYPIIVVSDFSRSFRRMFKWFFLGGVFGSIFPDVLRIVGVNHFITHSPEVWFLLFVMFLFYETYHYIHLHHVTREHAANRLFIQAAQDDKLWMKVGFLLFWLEHLWLDGFLNVFAFGGVS